MPKLNVAVFPCTSRNAHSVAHCLRNQVNINLLGFRSMGYYNTVDDLYYDTVVGKIAPLFTATMFARVMQTQPKMAKDYYYEDHLNSFRESFTEICEEHKIDAVIPTHDAVAYLLAWHDLSPKKVATSPGLAAMTCRSKAALYSALKGKPYMPLVFETYQQAKEYVRGGGYIFSKPDEGEGGKGCYLIKRLDDFRTADMMLESNLNLSNKRVLMEHIGEPGKDSTEITVDCFTRNGQIIACLPRLRWNVRDGIATSANFFLSKNSLDTLVRDYFYEIAKDISTSLALDGYWFFQMKHGGGCELDWKLLEVSVRPSTGVDFAMHAGINFPLMSVYYHAGFPLESPPSLHYKLSDSDSNHVLHRCGKVKHDLRRLEFNSVYIDLYDTILLPNDDNDGWHVNPIAMAFLYECANRGNAIYLLTRLENPREEHELQQLLSDYGIQPRLFDRLLQVNHGQKKSSVINNTVSLIYGCSPGENSFPKKYMPIFVDNSFKERQEVALTLQIPTLDVNELEGFLP
jgi:carbamoyl-phosphate synthase large subunit